MSEKRFVYGRAFLINSDDSLPVITDSENDKDYFRMLDIVDVLNTQQATIQVLERKLKKYAKIGEEQLKQIIELQEEIKRLEKMIWKIQWRFQQEVGIEKAREHYREIDKEMSE